MRYNIVSYLICEGFRNVFKNKKSTVASLVIMCATMIIFGFFFTIGENINYLMKNIEESQGIEVFIVTDATDEQINELRAKIENLDGINTIEYTNKEKALEKMKERFAERQDMLEGFPIFPASFTVTLTDLTLSNEIQKTILSFENVKKITSKDETVTALVTIANGIRIITGVLLILLVVISIFIISNTIKLTVHARRKEISIMKYVGATNNFIRAPFIVEGIIIGILSGMISIVIVGASYNFITNKILQSQIIDKINVFNLLHLSDMIELIIVVYLILGIGIGVIGSVISMRKYLKV